LGFLLGQKKFARLIGTVEAAYPEGVKWGGLGTYLLSSCRSGYVGLNNRAKAAEYMLRR
jgi:hypothetical protein